MNYYFLLFIFEIIIKLTKIKYITKTNIYHIFNQIRLILYKEKNLTGFIIKYDNY